MTDRTTFTQVELDIAYGWAIEEDAARNASPADARAAHERAEYIRGLRMLAEVLEKRPEVKLPVDGGRPHSRIHFYFDGTPDDTAAMAAARRAFPCTWEKHFSGGGAGTDWFDLRGELAGLHVELYAPRDAVCRPVVVGTEDREVEEVVQPAVTRKVTKRVEIIEWECSPVLAAEAPVMAPAGTSAAA